ncbi:MAG: phosphatidylglycerol lysyltransferase domain-containing protein [Fuerstiella sp.]
MSALSGSTIEQSPCSYSFSLSPAPAARSFEKLEQLARLYGGSYDSYIATDTEGKQYFWSSDGEGVLCTIPRGRYTFVYGGILAPPNRRRQLITEFVDACDRRRVTASFFNAGTEDVALLREFGFNATKFGEEPIVELDKCSWKGRDYEWVRRQTNFCLRHQLEFEEVRRADLSAARWQELMDEMDVISEHFLENRAHSAGIRNIVSRFSRDLFFGQRLFVARNRQLQRIEGFLVCNPCLGSRMWAIETYRKRRDAVRGVIPFLMHQSMMLFQQEEAPLVTLSMLPLIRCETPLPGDSWLLRRMVTWAHNNLGALYDSSGLYHFKTRFRPHRFDDRFICARPRVTPGLLWAGMMSWGFHRISLTAAVKKYWQQRARQVDRTKMASPDSGRARRAA